MNTLSVDIEAFFSRHRLDHYRAHEVLFTSEDSPPGVIYLKKGYVKQYSISEKGRELTVHIFSPQSYFPLTWALCDIPNQYNFEALTNTQVFIAPKNEVTDFLQTHPRVALALSKKLLTGITGLTKRLETIAFGTAYHRVVSVLIYLSSHFGEATRTGVSIRERFTHQDIADFTAMSREHVSLELKKLERLGFIRSANRRIKIPNLSNLSRQLTTSYK